jgi:hypothetical protein
VSRNESDGELFVPSKPKNFFLFSLFRSSETSGKFELFILSVIRAPTIVESQIKPTRIHIEEKNSAKSCIECMDYRDAVELDRRRDQKVRSCYSLTIKAVQEPRPRVNAKHIRV